MGNLEFCFNGLENIDMLLDSVLTWIIKPWTLACLNFYNNKIASCSLTKLNYVLFLAHIIFLYSSICVCCPHFLE